MTGAETEVKRALQSACACVCVCASMFVSKLSWEYVAGVQYELKTH